MATTMTPPVEAELPDPTSSSGGLRFINIRASLMPDEVLVARRVESLRRKILIGLGALVLIVVAGYAASWLQTRSADNTLDDLKTTTTALQAQEAGFGKVTKAQADAAAVQSQLATVMQGDLPWSSLLSSLRQQAPAGVQLTSVAGTVATTSGAAGGAGTGSGNLNQSGDQSVGTLSINGTASSQRLVAAYSDQLGRVKGVTAPLITSISAGADKGVSYTITATITTAALGGRYATTTAPAATPTTVAPSATGGK